MNAGERRLIVNADDFGFTDDVNRGIIDAHCNGILTSTTLMANGPAFDDAVRLARETATLDVGCHLVLVGGRSLLDSSPLPPTVLRLVAAVTTRRLRVYEELAAQIRRIVDAGLRPTHLDTHKHTHAFPPVLDAVARLSQEYAIRWVRRPPLDPFGKLAQHGCRMTDRFAGFRLTGKLNIPSLVRAIHALPPGTTEFMCHPGYCTEDLRHAPTRLKDSRQKELEALVSPEAWQALAVARVTLTSYRDLK